MKVKIAVVVSDVGNYRCCGPYDFDEAEFRDAMRAARAWTAESSEIIVSSWWVETELPDLVRKVTAGAIEVTQ